MSVGSSETAPALHHGNWPGGRLIIMLTIARKQRQRLKSSGSYVALLYCSRTANQKLCFQAILDEKNPKLD